MRQMATRGTTAAIVVALLLFSGSGRDLRANGQSEPREPSSGCDIASWAGETEGARDRYRENILQRENITKNYAIHQATVARCDAREIHGNPCYTANRWVQRYQIPTNRWANDCGRLLDMISENPELWNQQISWLMEKSGTILIAEVKGRCGPCTGAMLASIMRDRCDPMDTCEVIHALVNEGRGGNLRQKWDLMLPGLHSLYPSWRNLRFLEVPAFLSE